MNSTQPIYKDEDGNLRFKKNLIVEALLSFAEKKGVGLNELYNLSFPQKDWQQFAQLLGFSLSSYSSLPYVDETEYQTVLKLAKDANIKYRDAKIAVLEERLNFVKENLKEVVSELFELHPDDL